MTKTKQCFSVEDVLGLMETDDAGEPMADGSDDEFDDLLEDGSDDEFDYMIEHGDDNTVLQQDAIGSHSPSSPMGRYDMEEPENMEGENTQIYIQICNETLLLKHLKPLRKYTATPLKWSHYPRAMEKQLVYKLRGVHHCHLSWSMILLQPLDQDF